MFVVDDMLFVCAVRRLARWLDALSDTGLLAVQLRLHAAIVRSQTAHNAPCASDTISSDRSILIDLLMTITTN